MYEIIIGSREAIDERELYFLAIRYEYMYLQKRAPIILGK